MPATKKSSELLKKYLELFESKYTEHQEIITLGTFKKKDSLATTSRETTGKSSAGIKHKSNKPGSTDIRRWFKPASNKVNDPSTKKKRSEESSIIVIDQYFNITVVIKRETISLLIHVKVLYSPTCVL